MAKRYSTSAYVEYTLDELKEKFLPVQLYGVIEQGFPLGSGSRYVFWLGSDGRQAAMYATTGELYVVQTKSFTILRVHGSISTEVKNGRLMYMMPGADIWLDAGPVHSGGVKDGDPKMSAILGPHKSSAAARPEAVDVFDDPLFSMGDMEDMD
jgi:hypothetical protein